MTERAKSTGRSTSCLFVEGHASGDILVCSEGLSFWGGVDPDTGNIIDVHHPNYGDCVAGKILMMPTSRGSCSGSGVLLQLSLNAKAPAILVFKEFEEVLTLGALVSERIFQRPLPTIALTSADYDKLAEAKHATLIGKILSNEKFKIVLFKTQFGDLNLSKSDRALLDGDSGPAARMAMEIICLMATVENTTDLIDISRGHIDGCILAHSANLIFAEKLAELGAKVSIPTTINAISVDRENWESTNIPKDFGAQASQLADAYVRMGAKPTFTCAPYLLDNAPKFGERIGWSESNAVIFANTVLGARTPKHPDYFDLFIAITGRAPDSGVYRTEGRIAQNVLKITPPSTLGQDDELFWPLVGWLAGKLSPDSIPLVKGLEYLKPSQDDLKALCAAFGTTSGAPMLHITGHTPESNLAEAADSKYITISRSDFFNAWKELNRGEMSIDLVAIGSPHASIQEIKRIASLFGDRKCNPSTQMIITLGRQELQKAINDGVAHQLADAGVTLMPDLCWCSIVEPIFPSEAKGLFTNSGKYAHYSHGLSGRHSRIGSLNDCVQAAITGKAPTDPPAWVLSERPEPNF